MTGTQDKRMVVSISAELERIKERRKLLFDTVEELKSSVRLSEFESYSDYFLINKFKMGKSESGRVNVLGLRNRHNRSAPRRTKGNTARNGQSSRSLSSASDTEDEVNVAENTGKSKDSKYDDDYKPNNSSRSGTDVSNDLIISDDKGKGPVRRSIRLTRKEKEKRLKKEHKSTDGSSREEMETSDINLKHAVIQDLYENLVSKIDEPVRRSDWVLPPKRRYLPEKNQPVKHEPEQIKINELARNLRIKRILSRFDGGLAGVRTATT